MYIATSNVGCHTESHRAATEGYTASTSLSFKDYVHLAVLLNGGKAATFTFPQLRIYNQGGQLTYFGDNAKRNMDMLERKPEDLPALKLGSGNSDLSQVIEDVPAFKAHQDELLHNRRPTVAVVSLETCHACSLQDEALDRRKERLLQSGVNVLIINVSKTM